MPPSPRLFARIMKNTYLAVTTMISAQKISDNTPSTLSAVAASPYLGLNASRMVYRGLVPMSPKTTPMAAMVSAKVPCFEASLPEVFICWRRVRLL